MFLLKMNQAGSVMNKVMYLKCITTDGVWGRYFSHTRICGNFFENTNHAFHRHVEEIQHVSRAI